MEKELIKIYEESLKQKAYEKLYAEIEKDENFRINRSNIHEFIENNFIFEELKELEIPYEVKIEDNWIGKSYNAIVSIYIPAEYKYKIKTDTNYENESRIKEEEVIKTDEITEETELEEDNISILVYKMTNVFMDIIFLGIGMILLGYGIYILIMKVVKGENVYENNQELILIVIGGLSVIFRIRVKIKNSYKKKLNK